MGVAGVALATIIAQAISAGLILLSLEKSEGVLHLRLKELSFHKDKLFGMLRVGLPAGLQGVIFNISNVLIQSSINSFGSVVMAGNTAASNIEGFVYTSMNAVYQTSLSFTSQNYGAKQYHRIDKILLQCLGIVTFVGLFMGIGAFLLGHPLLSIYSSSEEVIQYGIARLSVVSASYFLCGIMDVFGGKFTRNRIFNHADVGIVSWGLSIPNHLDLYHLSGRAYAVFFICVLPISWMLTISAHLICYLLVRKKAFAK